MEQAGDTIAMWLPECSEKHVAQLAAARVGMVVADVDHKLASAEAIGKVLEESGATVRAECLNACIVEDDLCEPLFPTW